VREIEAVMEGGEGLSGQGGGSGLRLEDGSAGSLSFIMLKDKDKESCFVVVIQKYFLMYSSDLPTTCLFFFRVC